MRIMAAIALLAIWFAATAARADDPAPTETGMSLATGFETFVVIESDMRIERRAFRLAPELRYGPWTLAPQFLMVEYGVELHGKAGLPVEADFTFPWHPVIGARLDRHLAAFGPFRLKIRGEFEMPFARNKARISMFKPQGDLARYNVDIDDIREHVALHQDWRLLGASLIMSAKYRSISPWLQIGYLSLQSSVSVEPDAKLSGLLSAVNVHPARFYSDGANTPLYSVGIDARLGRGVELRYFGAMLPGERVFATIGGQLVIPLNFLE